jgi:hypothetical protein
LASSQIHIECRDRHPTRRAAGVVLHHALNQARSSGVVG